MYRYLGGALQCRNLAVALPSCLAILCFVRNSPWPSSVAVRLFVIPRGRLSFVRLAVVVPSRLDLRRERKTKRKHPENRAVTGLVT